MSVSSALALQRGLYTALTAALPGTAIHDHVPAEAPYPYVTLGTVTVRDVGGVAAPLDEHTLFVFVWSKAESRTVAAETAAAVRIALEDEPVTMTGHVLVNRAVEEIEITRDAKTRIYRARLRLRAATEPTA